MQKNEIIKNIIREFEDGKIQLNHAIDSINKISINTITEIDLQFYWKSMTLDEFISLILVSSITNWKDIGDNKALLLIEEIIKNTSKDTVIKRNSEALEKRYNKSYGIISDWIFIDDITNSKTILERLKDSDSLIKL